MMYISDLLIVDWYFTEWKLNTNGTKKSLRYKKVREMPLAAMNGFAHDVSLQESLHSLHTEKNVPVLVMSLIEYGNPKAE